MLAGQRSAPGLVDLGWALPSADPAPSQRTSGTVRSNRAQQEPKAVLLQDQAHYMTQEAGFPSDTCEGMRY